MASFGVQRAEHGDTEGGLAYVALGALATHLVSRLQAGSTEGFQAPFETVERLFGDGDDEIRYALNSVFSKEHKMSLRATAGPVSPLVRTASS